VSKDSLLENNINRDIVAYLDGPFGAPAEHFKNYEHLIFVASGVGVTPFSSILISMLYQLKKGETLPYKAISFFWIQREYCKTDYLNNILEEIEIEDKNKLFDINIFITGAQQKYDCRSLFLAEGIDLAKKDNKGKSFNQICSGNVYWGRPEWDIIFKKKTLKLRHEETKVGVFVCGNSAIVNDIYQVCENYNSAAVKFELNTEHF
jgi:predicted ferric reductase